MKKILGACIGDCVHIAGIHRFLSIAEDYGYTTVFLGPAVDNETIIQKIKTEPPDIIAVSYRLTPATGMRVLWNFKKRMHEEGLHEKEFLLSGLPELVKQEAQNNFFTAYFQGDDLEKVLTYLKGEGKAGGERAIPPQTITERIQHKKPFPVLRHHFGLPDMQITAEGIATIAESECLDVISLGTDQNAQANFFHPERMSAESGAGGVPVRSREDFERLYAASRQGNYPLLRTYAGTDDLIRLAQLYIDTIHNAWAAIPIFWFNQIDGRGPIELKRSITAHLKAIQWHAVQGIPVEILESHHWSLREASDEVAVAAGFLGASICKTLGVQHFISQYMFNTPPQTAARDDLAKMLAQKQLIDSLQDEHFSVYTQTRTGLFSYPVDIDMAKGQLAFSTTLQMQLDPDIVHVVSYSEANHAATPENVIESCRIAKQVITKCLEGFPRMDADNYVISRKNQLIDAVLTVIQNIDRLGSWTDPEVLYESVRQKILFAPQVDEAKIFLVQPQFQKTASAF